MDKESRFAVSSGNSTGVAEFAFLVPGMVVAGDRAIWRGRTSVIQDGVRLFRGAGLSKNSGRSFFDDQQPDCDGLRLADVRLSAAALEASSRGRTGIMEGPRLRSKFAQRKCFGGQGIQDWGD